VAASWSFKKILEHWSHKHSKAVYVPSKRQTDPNWQYAYGHKVRLAQGTDSLRLLRAFTEGAMYYDPGINPTRRSRNQKVNDHEGILCGKLSSKTCSLFGREILKNASTDKPKHKKRSQFRVASKNIGTLYETVETVEV
jgi:hypothetical protein